MALNRKAEWLIYLFFYHITSVWSFVDEIRGASGVGPVFFTSPNGTVNGVPLGHGSSVSTSLHIHLSTQSDPKPLPIDVNLWTVKELYGIQSKLPIGEHSPELSGYCGETMCYLGEKDYPCSILNLGPIDSERTFTYYLSPGQNVTIRPNTTFTHDGAYIFMISTCDPSSTFSVSGTVTWRSKKGGSLPDGLLGIVPFYGTLAGAYLLLGSIWTFRLAKFWGYTINLQLTLFLLLVANFIYAVLAFAYYLHVDLDTSATSRQVFGGTYAGFYEVKDPYALFVASYRFLLISTCEMLLTALCDGLFTLRHKVRIRTIVVMVLVISLQFTVLVMQGWLYSKASWMTSLLQLTLVVVWLLYLGYSSHSTWYSLYEADPDLHIRWATPLKQRVYKFVCVAIFLYPALTAMVDGIFFVFQDSWRWMWCKSVVFDVWMFVILVLVSWYWVPHSTAAQYAPLMEEIPAAALVMEMSAVTLQSVGSDHKKDGGPRHERLEQEEEEDEYESDDESQQMIV